LNTGYKGIKKKRFKTRNSNCSINEAVLAVDDDELPFW
jgi:hypothetical protein